MDLLKALEMATIEPPEELKKMVQTYLTKVIRAKRGRFAIEISRVRDSNLMRKKRTRSRLSKT